MDNTTAKRITSITNDAFLEKLESGNLLVIAPNTRIQQQIEAAYAARQSENHKSAWLNPNVHSLSSWIENTWDELQDVGFEEAASKTLASDIAMNAIWVNTILGSSDIEDVIDPASMTTQAMQAHRFISLWGVNDVDGFFMAQQEHGSFKEWYKQVQYILNIRNWVTKEGAIHVIISAIKQGYVNFPAEVSLFSFDEFPPLYQMLFDAMKEQGANLTTSENDGTYETMVSVCVNERSDQYLKAALWAKNIMENEPDKTVAIVCPELHLQREQALEAFNRVFEPQVYLPHVKRYTTPFNISVGVPLIAIPLVRDALNLLDIGDGIAPIDVMNSLLRSPFIEGAMSEKMQRAKFAHFIKRYHSTELRILDLISRPECPKKLAELVSKYLRFISNTPDKQSTSKWAAHFNSALEIVGWCQGRNLDSEEFQAYSQWASVLTDFAATDSVTSNCTRKSAIAVLKHVLHTTVFQPESSQPPVQILGVLEASGLRFDYMWIMDNNDDIWPPKPESNPFLWDSMQTELGMPHSSAERELLFSKQVIERLKHGAEHIVFSYAAMQDGSELRPSPLIEGLIEGVEEVELKDLELAEYVDYMALQFGAIPLLPVIDGKVPVKDPSKIRGGTGILTKQSSCPVKAFARYRLGATELPKLELGLTHTERGSVIHYTLEYFFGEIKSQKELLDLSREEQYALVDKGIDFAFFYIQNTRVALGEKLQEIERGRIHRLISEWLEIEKERKSFTVKSCEEQQKIDIAGLPLTISRDRVDIVDGKEFYLDYKTGGDVSPATWSKEIIEQPQLPIYAVYGEKDSIGAAFAHVRAGEHALIGFADVDDIGKGVQHVSKMRGDVPNDWDSLREVWKERLEFLATEFLEGDTSRLPAKPCRDDFDKDLALFCRHIG